MDASYRKIGPFSLSDVRASLRDLEPAGIRLFMRARGWDSEDRLSSIGWGAGERAGYQIWFSRWNWAGRRWDRITYHAGTEELMSMAPVAAAEAIASAVRLAAEICLRVEEAFPEDVPDSMDVNGRISVHWLWIKQRREAET